MADHVHPTAFGQVAIAERALAVLAADGMAVRARPSALIAPSRPSRPRRLQGDVTYAYRHAKVSARAAALIARERAWPPTPTPNAAKPVSTLNRPRHGDARGRAATASSRWTARGPGGGLQRRGASARSATPARRHTGAASRELLVPPEMRERHAAGLAHHLATGEATILGRRLELSAMRRDGSRIPVELTITRSDVEGEPLFIGFLRDLSGLHATQAALEEAEARFRRLVEQVPAVTYICDYDEAVSIRYISPQIETLTGYPPERWTEDPQFWTSVVHPGDRDWVVEELARHTREQIPVDFEYRFVAADGSIVHLLDQETIVRDAAGRPLYSQGVLVDVTELRRTEAKLRVSEAQMTTIVESAPMVLFAIDPDGVFTLSEGKALELLGLRPGEVVGQLGVRRLRRLPGEIEAAVRRALAGEHVSQSDGGRRARLRRLLLAACPTPVTAARR